MLPSNNYSVSLTDDNGSLDLWAVGVRGTEADSIHLGHGGTISTAGYDEMYLMVFNPAHDNNLDDCSYSMYSLDIKPGSDAVTPVEQVWDASHFLLLR